MKLLAQHTVFKLKDYVCNFECLTHCPFPDECIYDDPQMGDDYVVEYPEFFWWRYDHLTESQQHQLPEITPDSLDEFYPEPPNDAYRCPRCHSANVIIGESWIVCGNCKYNEPLIDFPENLPKIDDGEMIMRRLDS